MRRPDRHRRDRRPAGEHDGPAPLDDRELVRRCLERDEAAWRELVERHGPLIRSVARRHGVAGADAEDVTQWVLVTLAERLHHLADPQCLPKWLITTTTRRCRQAAGRAPKAHSLDLEPDLAAGGAGPDEAAGTAEHEAAVRVALAKLKDRDRELLLDFFQRGLSYTEVARQRGLAVGSLGSLRGRALARLRLLLERAGIDST